MPPDVGCQFIRFAIAGAVGFIVDAGVLMLGLTLGLGYFAGRAVSFLCAVFATWRINRRFSFPGVAKRSTWAEWWRYLAAASVGGSVNYLAYTAVVINCRPTAWLPTVAVGVGSLAGMVVNFATVKWWVFKHRNKQSNAANQ
ncbi:GtrA family protein [Caballeronia novacaledonica]|uniref:GtrA family protein n=1 Tax=Caballeronia novacaledonica TaxID=1544861 RepID=A0AA37MTQ3_9BURK|nr:GtrA family protein [Caballeronia novacaledonica]GJH28212.1 GtrA family protein [Caballeronia novacaledonica]